MNEELIAVRALRDQDRIDARLPAEITPDGRFLLEAHVADL